MFGQSEVVTVNMLGLALDAASLRHQAIANNIANANTPGYAPARVNFEQQLGQIQSALREGTEVRTDLLSGIRPFIERGAALPDADRTALLDTEIANLAQNTVQYEALLKALNKHMAILGSAIMEGKR